MNRSAVQLRKHYEIEKELANMLRTSQGAERVRLYNYVYDELYKRVTDHPLLTAKSENVEYRALSVQRIIKMLAPYFNKQSHFLEIGAGDCIMGIGMAALVNSVFVTELTDEIEKRTDTPSNMAMEIVTDQADIPADANSLDLIYSDQLAEHLHPDDFRAQCENVHQSLKPGGYCVIATPNRVNGPHDISRGFDELATCLHLKEYTSTELAMMMKEIGFTHISAISGCRGFYLRTPLLLVKMLEGMLTGKPRGLMKWIANTLPMELLLPIRLVAR